MMNRKFIGGPIAGQSRDVESLVMHYQVPVEVPFPGDPGDIALVYSAPPPVLEVFTYKQLKIRGANRFYEVFVPLDWDHDDLVVALIDGYKKP